MSNDLRHAIAIHAELRDRLKAVYGLDDDDPALIDTLEGLSDLDAAIAAVVREAREAEANASALDTIIEANRQRKVRWERKRESLRDLASWAMAESNLKKITTPDLTISVRAGKPKIIIDEGALAAEFIKSIITTKPDREAVKAAVDAGNVPNGVTVGNAAPVLIVRTS